MARLLVVSCLVACCAALQPSLILSARTAQAAQRTAAPVMKRPDYFLRVSRSEAGRPRLCVFRWAVATTNPRWIGRLALIGCLHPWLCASHMDAQQQLSFPPAGRPHRLPPFSAPAPSLSAHASSAQWQAGARAQPAFPTFTRTTHTRAPKNPRASHVPCFRSLAPRVHESSALTLAGWCAQVEQEHLRADHRRQQGRRPLLRLHQGEGHGRRHRQRCTMRPHQTPSSTNPTPNPSPEERGMGAATANGS